MCSKTKPNMKNNTEKIKWNNLSEKPLPMSRPVGCKQNWFKGLS